MTNWELFSQLWASEMNQTLTKAEGVEFWKKFANNCQWALLEEATLILSDQWQKRKDVPFASKPALPDLRSMYYSLDKKENPYKIKDCGICNNCGWVLTVQKILPAKNVLLDPKKPVALLSGDRVGEFASPCTCARGSKEYSEDFRNRSVANRFGSADGSSHLARVYIGECFNLGAE